MFALARSLGISFSWLVLQLVFVQAPEAAVGRTKGTFDVSATGAAIYQIPIWVPPGPKGIQPNLTLTYNSQQGDGTLGPGWSLSGLSAIARCNKTYAQDGISTAVVLAATDGYCLNGNRLRLTSGVYGVAGSTYQTEIADFSQVTANGTAGNGPASFTVQGRDGLIYEYGNTANSQIKASGSTTPYQWLLSKVRDRAGNNYVVTYEAGQSGSVGIGVPLSISYVPSSAGSTTYDYSISFAYGVDTDAGTESGYVAGGSIVNNNRLTSITVQRGITVIHRYNFGYELATPTNRYRLTLITECPDTAIDATCLSPTTIVYQNGANGVQTANSITLPMVSIEAPYMYDMNGDGRKDLVWGWGIKTDGTAGGTVKVAFSTANGTASAIDTGINVVTDGLVTSILFGDFFGDGKIGFLLAVNNVWWSYTWNGSSFVGVTTGIARESNAWIYNYGAMAAVADINGDGRADLITARTDGYVYTRLNTTVGNVVSFSQTVSQAYQWKNSADAAGVGILSGQGTKADFNGDGIEDVAVSVCLINQFFCNTVVRPLLAIGTTLQPITNSIGAPLWFGATKFVDWNDDSCTDIAASDVGAPGYIYITGCNGSVSRQIAIGTDVPVSAVMDWNNDGRQDILIPTTSQYLVYLSTGNGVSAPIATGIPVTDSTYLSFGKALPSLSAADMDGDGLDDLLLGDNVSAERLLLHNSPGIIADLATSIADGYGVSFSPKYVSIAQSNYALGSITAYPESNFTSPLHVVSQATVSDGAGSTYTKNYNYAGAKQNKQGRGLAGFQSITMADSRAGAMKMKTYYKTAFPYAGMMYQQDVYQNNGTTLISRTVNTPGLTTLDATANNQRYFPYVASSASDMYEVGGVKNGVLITQGSTSFTYDNFGNRTNSTFTVTDRDNTAPASLTYDRLWTTTITNTISPNTANWCLGLPTQTTVTNSATSITAITRTTNYTPDYVNCRMTQQVVEPASSLYKATTDLAYDGFGNVNSQTVTGINMAARVTTVNWGNTGQFPVSFTNPLNQTTQAGYDYNKGVQISQTDPNNLTTSWQYDSFNRKIMETRPDTTSTSWSYNDCAGVSGGCQNGDPIGASSINKMVVIATSKDASGGTIRDDWTYLDQLDRAIVTKSKTLSGSYSRVGVQYDSFGNKLSETAPCDAASCSAYWNTYSYDALNRVTQIQRPVSASNSTLQTTTIAYQGMTTVTTDPQGKQATKVKDPNGRLRRSKDANGYYQDFSYDAFGSLKGVTDQASNSLFYAYYGYGINAFQTQTIDMDLGTWVYTPNALGEVTSYTDARGSAFSLTYDKLSRPLTRFVSGEGTTTWTWGNSAASFNIGQLQSLTNTVGTTENYTYDNRGRFSQRQIVSDATYNYNYTYNATTGLLDTVVYPTSTSGYRLTLKYLYQNGLLSQMKDNNGSMVFWRANAMNPRGQITQETLGNGIVTNRSFDAVTGWLSSIQSGVGGGAGVQNEAYLFDKVGNVTQRQNNMLGLTENFYYDNVYRLDYSQLNGVTNLDLTYNNLGNITNRTDVASNATWTYHATKKHAVTQAGSSSFTYTYDANGNAITRNGFSIAWNKYNYPTSIAGSGETAALSYDGNHQRWRQVYVKGSTTETTIYVGSDLQKVTTGSTVDWRHSIKVGTQTVALYSRLSSGTNTLRFMLEDYQGSPSKITTSTGTTYVSENFTAFGNRRNPATWSGAPTSTDLTNINAVSRQGYTGHDLLGSLGLNHMNGRVQDAITGRFLSADPYITEPGNTQNYNRYSYVYNNPLSFTDPSGFCGGASFVTDSDGNQMGLDPPCEPPNPHIGQPAVPGGPATSPGGDGSGGDGDEGDEGEGDGDGDKPQEKKCYAPFSGGDSFASEYAARLGNLAAGLLDSFSAGLDLGPQLSGSVNFFGIKPSFSAGVFNGNLSLTGAGNLTLSVKSPSPGSLAYGEASLSVGPVKVGTASSSVTEGISTRSGSFQQVNQGFSGMAKATAWKSDIGKIGAHVQVGVGAKVEWDAGAALRALGCAVSQ